MQKNNGQAARILLRLRKFRYLLVLEGILAGIAAGLTVVIFRLLLSKAEVLLDTIVEYSKQSPVILGIWFVVLILASLAVTLLLKWEPYISGSGIPQVKAEMLSYIDQKWWRVILAKCMGGFLSIGCGLSLGREGPSIQLGAMTAKGVSRALHRGKNEEKFLLTCGAASGLAAAFNAPLAGVLFCLEEIHKNFSEEVLLSTMASAVTADLISRNVFGLSPVFSIQVTEMMPLGEYGHVVLLGVILGALGVLYNHSIAFAQRLYAKLKIAWLRLLFPFVCAGILVVTLPQVLGGGHALVMDVSRGNFTLVFLLLLFVVKFLFSMASFGSGAPGGIFLPLLVLGSLIGASYHEGISLLCGAPENLLPNFIILGMAGYFSAIVRAPVTGIVLISEMTGSFEHLLTLTLVSLAAYLIPDLVKCKPIYDQLLQRLLQAHARKKIAEGEALLLETVVAHGSSAEHQKISEVAWPEGCLVVSLLRNGKEIVPSGNTRLLAEDALVVMCREENAGALEQILETGCRKVFTDKE